MKYNKVSHFHIVNVNKDSSKERTEPNSYATLECTFENRSNRLGYWLERDPRGHKGNNGYEGYFVRWHSKTLAWCTFEKQGRKVFQLDAAKRFDHASYSKVFDGYSEDTITGEIHYRKDFVGDRVITTTESPSEKLARVQAQSELRKAQNKAKKLAKRAKYLAKKEKGSK